MLSESQRKIQTLIETRLSNTEKDEALLFHVSVERKLLSIDIWLGEVKENILPVFITQYGTYSTGGRSKTEEEMVDLDSILVKLSAYMDAFFMSGKSVLDAFAHEIRSLYGLGSHTGDLYFGDIPGLFSTHHPNTSLDKYLNSLNIKDSEWYKNLNSYRTACAHESIIQIKPSIDLDFLRGHWETMLLKLPIDPAKKPLSYDGKNFIETGKIIKDKLYGLIEKSYDKILDDIKSGQTKIVYI